MDVYTNKRRKCLIKFRDTFGMLHCSGPVEPQSGLGRGIGCGHWVASAGLWLRGEGGSGGKLGTCLFVLVAGKLTNRNCNKNTEA